MRGRISEMVHDRDVINADHCYEFDYTTHQIAAIATTLIVLEGHYLLYVGS